MWCNVANTLWDKRLFIVDPSTGYVVFADKFPFEEAKIDKNTKIKIDRWDTNTTINIKEPSKELLKVYHDKIYLPERRQENLFMLCCCSRCQENLKNKDSDEQKN